MTEALRVQRRDGAVCGAVGIQASSSSVAWRDANWRYLVAEVRRLAHVLERHAGMATDEARAVEIEANVEAELAAARRALSAPSALDLLQVRFGLSAFERDIVLMCAAFALDPALVTHYGSPTLALALAVSRDARRGTMERTVDPTAPGDALTAGTRASWGVLAPGERLDHHLLIEVERCDVLLSSSLRIARRVLYYLMGAQSAEPRLDGVLARMGPAMELMGSHASVAARIAEVWQANPGVWPVIELWGDDATVRRAVSQAACQQLGWSLFELPVSALPRGLDDLQLVRLVSREARLEPMAIFLDGDAASPGEPGAQARLAWLAEAIAAPIVLARRDRGERLVRPAIAVEVPRPQLAERRALLLEALAIGGVAEWPGVWRDVERVVSQFQLSASEIRAVCQRLSEHSSAAGAGAGTQPTAASEHAVAGAEVGGASEHAVAGAEVGGASDRAPQGVSDGAAQGAGEPTAQGVGDRAAQGAGASTAQGAAAFAAQRAALPAPSAELGGVLWDVCRAEARTHLDGLARRCRSRVSWDDLVIAEPQLHTLREITMRVRQRACVYETWGFGAQSTRGLGLTALFTGYSGTGKTLAAEVIANELQLDLYRIDLSQVVSKYIGETERNLGRVFDAAESGASVLLFDEADALFGKRSEVKDSHDRYANIEVGYLLQRMESYRGLAILTTNFRTALDVAFLRRIAFVVEFQMPDVAMREAIWRRVFPEQMPTDGLDFDRLAQLPLSGGSIRNVALAAAFHAADAGMPVAMAHVAAAARSEYRKLERPSPDALRLL